eukprot:m.59424 g.59424  ORF g.59424 m.59424 type:complete len:213 (+) comp9464_c0_seq2:2878-3516(+)
MFQKRPPPPHEILVRKGGVPQEVITALKESGVPVRVWPEDPRDQLLDVDFVVGKSAAITLLTESDVTAMDRDLLRMRFTAVKGYSRPLVLVWKSVTCADGYLRAQTLASTEFRVAVVPVSSATEAARFTKTMHDQEQRNTPHNTWKSLTDPRESNTQVLAALTEVPGLGKKRAEKLLQRFPSLKLIANADQQALADWIGDGPGRAVYAYFHS